MKQMEKNNKYTLYQIFGILLLCISLISLFYRFTVSWFMDESITSNKPNMASIGTVELDITTNFKFNNLALTPDTTYTKDQLGNDIGTYIKTKQGVHDTIGAYVRVKYTCNRPEITLYFNGNLLPNGATYSGGANNNKWYLHTDGYYYYIGVVPDDNPPIQFNAGYTVDNTLDNSKKSEPVTIQLDFETVQRPYGAHLYVFDTSPQIFKDFAQADMIKKVINII